MPADRPTRDGQIGVHLRAEMLHSVVLVSTWPSGSKAWLAALRKALGRTLPKAVGDTEQFDAGLLLRVGPEEMLLVGEPGQPEVHELVASLRQQVSADIGSVLDLSHARCRIGVKGEQAVATLCKLYALDFRAAAFPSQRVQLTAQHHVPCALHRTGDKSFDAYVLSTYAREQLETFADAALEHGVVLHRVASE